MNASGENGSKKIIVSINKLLSGVANMLGMGLQLRVQVNY